MTPRLTQLVEAERLGIAVFNLGDLWIICDAKDDFERDSRQEVHRAIGDGCDALGVVVRLLRQGAYSNSLFVAVKYGFLVEEELTSQLELRRN